MSDEIEYVTKDTITCEKCSHPNIIKVRNIGRKKRPHMVYTDDQTWNLVKTESSAFGQSIGAFLAFIIGFYRDHKERFSVPEVSYQ